MKSIAKKRIPAIFVAVALLFVSAFSVSISASAVSFSPRLSAPDYSNRYYYSDDNLYHRYGWGLPNCTAYAYGRAYEILGYAPNLSPYSAESWYNYNISNGYYDYGQTPRLGAIACWSYGSGGHVAVVEQINSDGSMVLSNSEWGGRSFYLTYANTWDSNPGGNSWWSFQGYIYVIDTPDVIVDQPDDPTDYSEGVYVTDVYDSSLNMRSDAGTGYSVVASIDHNVRLNVTEVKKASGYTWGYTTYNGVSGWVALNFCEFVSNVFDPEPPTIEPPTIEPITEPATTQPTSKPDNTQIGDVNNDGNINIADASLIQKYVTGTATLSEKQLKSCDFNFDGKVSIADVTAIQHYLTSEWV